MIEQLVDQIEARFAEVQELMGDPDVLGDRRRMAEVGREFRQLEPAAKLAEQWRLAQSDAQGALPTLYAATMPDVRPGDYWGPALLELRGAPKRVGRAPAAQDDVVAHRLWEVSEDLTGVRYDLVPGGV